MLFQIIRLKDIDINYQEDVNEWPLKRHHIGTFESTFNIVNVFLNIFIRKIRYISST